MREVERQMPNPGGVRRLIFTRRGRHLSRLLRLASSAGSWRALRAAQVKRSYDPANSLKMDQAAALSAKARVFAALDDGKSISVTCAGGSPMSLRPAAAAVEPLN